MHNTLTIKNTITVRTVMKVVLGVAGLFAAAQISIPVKPVAITLQSLFIMFIGLTYTRKEAISTVGAYLSCGALGMPMFIKFGSGIPYMMGPTGGYLLGFMLCAYSMAYMKEKFNIPNLYNCIIGSAMLYIPGVLWLSNFIGLEAAFYKGFLLYIPSGIVKVVMLVSILRLIKKS